MTERSKAILGLIISFLLVVIGSALLYSVFSSTNNIKDNKITLLSNIATTSEYEDEDEDEDKANYANYYKEAVVAHKNSEFEKSVGLLKKQISTNSEHAQSYYLLARIYEDVILPGNKGKMLTEMKSCYLQYLRIKPNGIRSNIVKLKLAKHYLRFALISNNQDDLDRAQKLLLSLDQNDPDVKITLGIYYLAKNNNDKAIVEFENVVNVQNGDAIKKYNNLGLAYLRSGKFTKAAMVLEKAVSLEPNNDYAFNNLGIAYLNSSKFLKAKKSFEAAVKINPENNKAVANLKWISTNKEILRKMRVEQENIQNEKNMK